MHNTALYAYYKRTFIYVPALQAVTRTVFMVWLRAWPNITYWCLICTKTTYCNMNGLLRYNKVQSAPGRQSAILCLTFWHRSFTFKF